MAVLLVLYRKEVIGMFGPRRDGWPRDEQPRRVQAASSSWVTTVVGLLLTVHGWRGVALVVALLLPVRA